jgi:class 3 adenylate cyclase
LYADLENFTRICEEHAPREVLQILNDYFASVTEAIEQTGGIVNQFHGDAILVTYNVPVADPHHADNAISAALAIQRMVSEKTFAGMTLRVRIGISTGQVVAGAVGGGDRLSYTVYGDAVNLAARLEALNKEMGSLVLVSDTTVARARNTFPLQPIGEVTVRGKQNPASVYKLNV